MPSLDRQRIPIARGNTRDAGFVMLWREMITCYARIVGPVAVSIWALLRDHVHNKSDVASGLTWVGYRLIGFTFGIVDRRTIKQHIDALDHAGLIERRRAVDVVGDSRDRSSFGINDRAVVYLVHEPARAKEFAEMTFGRYCAPDDPDHRCKFFDKCPAWHEAKGKIRISEQRGELSVGGGVISTPPVVEKSHHNNTESSVVVVPPHLARRLTDLDIPAKRQTSLVKKYGADYVLQKVEMAEARLDTIDVPVAWITSACKYNYLPTAPSDGKPKGETPKSGPARSSRKAPDKPRTKKPANFDDVDYSSSRTNNVGE